MQEEGEKVKWKVRRRRRMRSSMEGEESIEERGEEDCQKRFFYKHDKWKRRQTDNREKQRSFIRSIEDSEM